MNKIVVVVGLAASIAGTGCMSTASWRDEELENEINYAWQKTEPGGHWDVTSFKYIDKSGCVAHVKNDENGNPKIIDPAPDARRERDILDYVKHHGDYQEMFKPNPEYKSIPVSMTITVEDGKSTTGTLALLNNALSICSLSVWPFVWSGEKNYKIEAQYPNGKLERTIVIDRREMLSILPLGLIPVPAWSDLGSRGSGSISTVDNVYADFENQVLRKQILRFLNIGQYVKEKQILDEAAKK